MQLVRVDERSFDKRREIFNLERVSSSVIRVLKINYQWRNNITEEIIRRMGSFLAAQHYVFLT